MTMETAHVKARLTEYIRGELLSDPEGRGPDDDEDLLGGGVIDSLGVMSLVYFVEQEFGFEVPPEHVTIENFLSVETLSRYVTDRLS